MFDRRIGLIALDLDGTLLDSNKNLSEANYEALKAQAEKGVEIVPTTGRFYGGMPEVIRNLPFVHYVITINGAQVYDAVKDKTIATAEIPVARAVEVMRFLDTQAVAYDCYMESRAWMTESMKNGIEQWLSDAYFLKMVRDLRTPVPELKKYISDYGRDIQKILAFTRNGELRLKLLKEIPERFENIITSSSIDQNIEINDINANKGNAIRQLTDYIGLDISETIAFGDGLNDLSMIKEAGIGVAMSNAHPEVLKVADYVTVSNDEDGVAKTLERVNQ